MGFHAYCTGKVASKPNYLILTTKLYPKRWPLDIALAADMELGLVYLVISKAAEFSDPTWVLPLVQ